MSTKRHKIIYILIIALLQFSCNKYLDKKPSQSLAVPSTLDDLQAVLDNQVANSYGCKLPEFVSDNYYLTTVTWNNLPTDLRKNYIWANDATFSNTYTGLYGQPYTAIYQANFVLDLLPDIKYNTDEISKYNSIKGTALFYRSFMYHGLSQVFCKPYSTTAASEPGLVLRKTSDVTVSLNRSTVQETYDLIIADLKSAAELLPVTSQYNTRPNKSAAYGLMSRVYLSMRDYTNAEKYAEAALGLTDTLLNYNSLTPSGNPVLPTDPLTNPEILYQSSNRLAEIFNPSNIAIVDSNLYQSYSANDWRKSIYFGLNSNGSAYWKGSYYTITTYAIFDGIVTDEMYLNRAECRARNGNGAGAMNDLNALLRMRYKTGTFTDLTAVDANDALNKVLVERRKELAFRGLRWSDLRRFNQEGAGITLKRIVNNNTYTISPNDLRWVLLIPEVEINRSGISQNQR